MLVDPLTSLSSKAVYLADEADARIAELEALVRLQGDAIEAEAKCREWAQKRIAELEPSAKWFGEVMAILHGDGGHYLAKHGAEKAALDAVDKYHALVAERGAARADAEELTGFEFGKQGFGTAGGFNVRIHAAIRGSTTANGRPMAAT
jgi:hypothetical protein